MVEPSPSTVEPLSAMEAEDDGVIELDQAPDAAIGLDKATGNDSSPILPSQDVEKILAEQNRTMKSKLQELGSTFPPLTDDAALISVAEASIVLLTMHVRCGLIVSYHQAISYIEKMLQDQLTAAVGKKLFRLRRRLFACVPPPRPGRSKRLILSPLPSCRYYC